MRNHQFNQSEMNNLNFSAEILMNTTKDDSIKDITDEIVEKIEKSNLLFNYTRRIKKWLKISNIMIMIFLILIIIGVLMFLKRCYRRIFHRNDRNMLAFANSRMRG